MKQVILFQFFLLYSITSLSQSFIKEKKYEGEPLFDFVSDWYGVKYVYGGTTKKGIDCSAFTLKLYKSVYDISLPRTAQEQFKSSKKIKKSELKDGDLIFFRTTYKSTWHVGVYLIDGWFIHSKSKIGVTFDNLNDSKYSRLYYGSGRFLKDSI